MEKKKMETDMFKEKSSKTDNYTSLHLFSKQLSGTGNQNWIWGSTGRGGVGVVLLKVSVRRGIQMPYKWAIDVLNTAY